MMDDVGSPSWARELEPVPPCVPSSRSMRPARCTRRTGTGSSPRRGTRCLTGPAPGGSGRPIVALGRRQSAFFPSSPHFPSLHVPEVSISSQSPSHPCRVRLPFVLGPSWQTNSQRKKSPELSSVRIRRIALQWPCPAPPHRLHLPPPPPLQLPLLQHQLWHVPQVRILRQTLDCVRPPCSHKWHWHGPNFSRPS